MIGYAIHNFLRKALDCARHMNMSCRVTVDLERSMDTQEANVNREDSSYSSDLLSALDDIVDDFNCGDVNEEDENELGMHKCHRIPFQSIQFVIRTHMYASPKKKESSSDDLSCPNFISSFIPRKGSSQFMRSAGIKREQ